MDLHTESLDVVGTVGSTGEVGKVELDLVPALVHPHWHGANKWFDSRGRLVVGGTEASSDVLVVENLNFESEVLFQLSNRKRDVDEILREKYSRMSQYMAKNTHINNKVKKMWAHERNPRM